VRCDVRELFVDARVSVSDGESVECRGGAHVLIDGDSLLVGTEHWRVVIGVSHSQLDLSHVHVTCIRVLDVDSHVEHGTRQCLVVDRLVNKHNTPSCSTAIMASSYIAAVRAMLNVRYSRSVDQLPLSLKAKINRTVLTWEFPVLNVYLLV